MSEVNAAISNHPSASATENLEPVPLSESEERFRLVLEASPDGFIILRSIRYDAPGEIADFQIEYTNSVAAISVNRTPEELLGQYLLQLFPDCQTSGIFARYVKVAETGISETFETFSDSKYLTGWFRNVVVKLNDGIVVSFSNITDRKQAELALLQQEQHFKIALQTAKLGSWEHDLTTGVLTCSAQCKAHFGLPPDAEFTHETLFAALHPDDRPLVQAAIERSIAERIDYEVEERCYHPDGSLHSLIVRGQLVYDSKGTPVRLVGVTLDISERKQFEQSLQAADQRIFNILESITDAFVAFDRDWRYTYINQEAARMLGRSPQELLGQRWQEAFTEVDPQNSVIAQQFEQAMADQTTVRFEAFSLVINRWLDISLFPSPDGLAMYFRDISDFYDELRLRKRAEQRRDVQYAITRILAEAKTFVEATPAILQTLCENLGWQLGAIWKIDSHLPLLRCINYWQVANVDMQEFVEATEQITFAQGIGLPGRVWASRQPHWISELSQDSNFPRMRLASQVGLQSGLGFPILLGDEIVAVIECFSQHVQEPDEDLLDMIAAIGSQIGQFMERKQTETALQESQELFQSFMNHSPVAAFIKDESGRYVYVNAKVERLIKRGQSDLIGKTDFELLPATTAQQFHTNDMTVLTSGQPIQILEIIQHEDGEDSYYMSVKFPFRNAAGQQLLAGVALDVSEQQAALRDRIRAEEELRQREAELRLITNAVPVLISFIDAQQRYRFSNQKYEEWFGNPTTEVYGKYMWEVLGEAAYATIRPYVEQVLAGQEASFESKLLYKGAGTRFVRGTYVPRFDQQGKVEGFVALVSDITQPKQAEETLRQSEERLRIAQQAANAGVWDWDIVTNQVTWSDEYYLLYGLERGTIQPSYEHWLFSIVEQDRDLVDQATRKALANSTDLNVEFRILHPIRGERWLTAIGQTFYDDNGQSQRMTGIALDITKRKRAEEALRESEAFNREILESSRDCIKVLDLEGSLLYMSPGGQTLLGIDDITPFIRSSWVNFWPEIDHSAAQAALNNAITVGVGTFQGYCLTLAGEPKYLDVKVTPIRSADGQVERLLCISRDITERKQIEQVLRQNEQQARLAIKIGRLGTWRYNHHTDIVELDERMREIWGEPDDAEELPLPSLTKRIHPDDRERIAIAIAAAFAPGSSGTYEMDYRIIWDDGTDRWISANGQVQFEGEGQSRRAMDFFGTALDITDRKQAEQEREHLLERERAAREQAETANRIKDEFLAVLSHELRSPLNPILGWSRLLQKAKLDEPKTKQALATIERNAQLQAELIEDLLDVSRILQGKLSLTSSPINLASTIKAALETVRLAAEAKSIRIKTNLDAEIGSVLGDSTRLQQVMWNLLSNAVKFTPAGGRVEVQLSQIDTQAQITVSDTGKGIAPDFLPYVFDYFRQADSTSTRKFGGLGLGLAIVRHLVDLHGGTIQAESRGEGMGAIFTLKLPLMPFVPIVNEDSQLSEASLSLHGIQVLVVDDDADARDFVAFLLEQEGARVITAASAFEALTALTQSPPDILLSDIGMPEMDGYMLMRQIRALPPAQGGQIPAIALTAYAGELDEKQALKVGFQKHISKPISLDNLLKAIINLIGLK
ncbi:PAS domain-containing protein [Anabaena sphaerica FACHB-251]|uniref:Circadian input-output histidine kinase CikA n=1 Tax=Anabaena sphaerica FACHB-251 TaxID=2692883 RepID=A0A926WHU7_9NOST|nr:PAS domain-containing protein [Anabaena sphaerica]MBD2293428.1 PAS domain-containing protein [Anabaena sphaerica FACHB-251]